MFFASSPSAISPLRRPQCRMPIHLFTSQLPSSPPFRILTPSSSRTSLCLSTGTNILCSHPRHLEYPSIQRSHCTARTIHRPPTSNTPSYLRTSPSFPATRRRLLTNPTQLEPLQWSICTLQRPPPLMSTESGQRRQPAEMEVAKRLARTMTTLRVRRQRRRRRQNLLEVQGIHLSPSLSKLPLIVLPQGVYSVPPT